MVRCGAGLVQSSYFSMDTAKMPAGMGSGFIWDDKGHVVTNFHVIKDANEVQVTLVDQSVWPAKVRCLLSQCRSWHAHSIVRHMAERWDTTHAMQIQYLHKISRNHTVRLSSEGVRNMRCQLRASILTCPTWLPSVTGVSIDARSACRWWAGTRTRTWRCCSWTCRARRWMSSRPSRWAPALTCSSARRYLKQSASCLLLTRMLAYLHVMAAQQRP